MKKKEIEELVEKLHFVVVKKSLSVARMFYKIQNNVIITVLQGIQLSRKLVPFTSKTNEV